MIQNFLLAEGGAGPGGGGMLPLMMLGFIGLMYFMMIRPQRQQQKRQDEVRANLSKGDKVVTIGGIHGIITGMTKETVTVKVTDGTSIKFDRSAIATCLTDKPKEDDKDEDSDSEDDESEED